MFSFQNEEVAAKYEAVETPQDFKIRVPQAKWPANMQPGWYSQITPEVAEQLIAEGYNRIKLKDQAVKKK